MPSKWEELINRAHDLMSAKSYAAASEAFQLALEHSTQSGNDAEAFEALTGLACSHAAAGNRTKAIEFYSQAISLKSPNINRFEQALCRCSLANIYHEMKQFDMSRSLALHALTILETEDCENYAAMIVPLSLLCELCINAKDRDGACYFFTKAEYLAHNFPHESQNFIPKLESLKKSIAKMVVMGNIVKSKPAVNRPSRSKKT